MMEFKVRLDKELELYEEDASLSLGWFNLKEKELEVSFFSTGYCMVFITLSSLLDLLYNMSGKNKSESKWIGDDNGVVFNLKKKGETIELSGNSISLSLEYDAFKNAVFIEATRLIDHCKNVNKNIGNESAFIDLESSLSEYV